MHPKKLLEAFKRGENITCLLREHGGLEKNTERNIEIAYDLQAGSYVRALNDIYKRKHKEKYGKQIAMEISGLTEPHSILEAGVGEGTTLSFVAKEFGKQIPKFHGFDISWSRIAFCKEWLLGQGLRDVFLSVACITQTPYGDNSFDVVYTSHSIEPNGGKEKPILEELFRITSRYLILLEPGFEFANDNSKTRMKKLGYCRGLLEHAKSLGLKVVKHEPFPFIANPMNPTAITVISKDIDAKPVLPKLVCPCYKTPLIDFSDSFYSPDSFRAYPKIQKIPCLRSEDGIISSAYRKYIISE